MSSKPGLIAVIPARGGSKRIPRKNARLFKGVPLVCRAVSLAVSSRLFSRVVVSTDDSEIAALASGAGAEVPFIRGHELSDDLTPTAPVIIDALQRILPAGFERDGEVCVIYPGAVGVEREDLSKAIDLLRSSGAEHLFVGCQFPSAPARAWRLEGRGLVVPVWPDLQAERSQDLEPQFFDAGQFYWSKFSAWFDLARGVLPPTMMYQMSRWRVHDIDTIEDWEAAEIAFEIVGGRG